MLYEKTIVAGRNQPLKGFSGKQLILSCENVKTDNLQLENPWKIGRGTFKKVHYQNSCSQYLQQNPFNALPVKKA